jgi:hypothetical protein
MIPPVFKPNQYGVYSVGANFRGACKDTVHLCDCGNHRFYDLTFFRSKKEKIIIAAMVGIKEEVEGLKARGLRPERIFVL